jgi:hypothetical protein
MSPSDFTADEPLGDHMPGIARGMHLEPVFATRLLDRLSHSIFIDVHE